MSHIGYKDKEPKKNSMHEILTIQEVVEILGFKKINEAKNWLKWQLVQVTDVAHNSFVKRKDFETALEKLINKNSQSENSQHTYIPQGQAEREFYNKLVNELAKHK